MDISVYITWLRERCPRQALGVMEPSCGCWGREHTGQFPPSTLSHSISYAPSTAHFSRHFRASSPSHPVYKHMEERDFPIIAFLDLSLWVWKINSHMHPHIDTCTMARSLINGIFVCCGTTISLQPLLSAAFPATHPQSFRFERKLSTVCLGVAWQIYENFCPVKAWL